MSAGRPKQYRSEFREHIMAVADKKETTLVGEIDELTKKLFSRRNHSNPEEVSTILVELAVKNVGLGNYLIEALDLERQAESHYKYKVEKKKLALVEEGDSATVAESKARVDAKRDLDTLNGFKRTVELLKIKRGDTEKVMDAARSRLSLIKNDLRG